MQRGGDMTTAEWLAGTASSPRRGSLVTWDQLDEALNALRRELGQQLEAALGAQRLGRGAAEGLPRGGGSGPEPSGKNAGAGGMDSEPAIDEALATEGGAGDRGCELAVTPTWQGAGDTAVQEEEVALTESIWDAALFVGCAEVGLHASAFTAAALVLNAAMQVVFCVIVNDSLTSPHIDVQTVADFTEWRTTVAHNLKYVDDLTFRSLARKVCSFQDTPMAAGPIEGLAAISQYQPDPRDREYRSNPPLGYWMDIRNVGELMCMLSLIVWWLTVLKEVFSIVSLGQALHSLPAAGATEISDTHAGRLALVSMSRVRKAMVVGVLTVRSFVCLFLAVCGTFYLASTISLGDLLLNALALEIVLSLDELTFDVLAPRPVRLMISSLAPLSKPGSHAWQGLDSRPVVASAAIVAGLVCVYQLFLTDQSQTILGAREALCGGNLDFIASVDNTGLVVAYNESSTSDYTSWYEYRALRSLIHNRSESAVDFLFGSSTRFALGGLAGNRFSLEGMSDQSISDRTAYFNTGCYDMDYQGSMNWPTLSDILGSAESKDLSFSSGMGAATGSDTALAPFSSCADVAPKCGEESTVGVRARQYCPATCGCGNPAAPLVLSGSDQGCPKSCTESEWHTQVLGSLNCSDWTPESPPTLWGIDLLDMYVEGLRSTGWLQQHLDGLLQSVQGTILRYGCPGLVSNMSSPSWWLGNLCEETNWFKFRPITAICPVSCGCPERGGPFCPTSC